MKWKHDFYQDNPDTNDKYAFYHSQRRACAILEVVREIKSNYYEAKVISIESDENFRVMGQAGGCKHQYKIALAVTAICCFISLFKSCGNRQDISGTVIAKVAI